MNQRFKLGNLSQQQGLLELNCSIKKIHLRGQKMKRMHCIGLCKRLVK